MTKKQSSPPAQSPPAIAIGPVVENRILQGEPYSFVIGSFGKQAGIQAARLEGIYPAIRRFGFQPCRVDQSMSPGYLRDTICRYIVDADFVVADLTGQRGNCYYEVGYAHATGRPVILAIRADQKPAFDVANFPFIRYENPDDLRRQVEVHIESHVLTTHGTSADPLDNKGKFGHRAFVDPYIVTGRVRADPTAGTGELRFLVDVRVRSVNQKRPVTGRVVFVLHGEFAARRQPIDVHDGEAILTDISCFGSFTVGVELQKPGVKLELDLSTVPGATAEFRSR